MSFEGYYRVLCKNGHCDTLDCYWSPDFNISETNCWLCRDCGKEAAWVNLVNTTNGSYEYQNGKEVRIDGYVELEIEEESVTTTCPTCGTKKCIKPQRYKIPKNKKQNLINQDV